MSVPQPYWTDGQVDLHHADCLDLLPLLPAESVDAVICDPPYGLTELTTARVLQAIAAWMAGDRTHVPDGPAGFMGRTWDSFVPPPGVWDECLRVLKPGGHLLVFAGPRTMDLMGLSIRIAGFEMRDAVADLTGVDGPGLLWVYGNGFPKSLDVSKAIDGHLLKGRSDSAALADMNAERPGEVTVRASTLNGWKGFVGAADEGPREKRATPATEDAACWSGWGTALKPAWEPVIVARKPLAGTVAANVQRYGTGAINVDACRVHSPGSEGEPYTVKRLKPRATLNKTGGNWRPADGEALPWEPAREYEGHTKDGRWPANLVLAHSPSCVQVGERIVKGDSRAGQEPGIRQGGFLDVGAPSGDARSNGSLHGDQVAPVYDCTPGCPVAEMDRQSGDRTAGSPVRGTEPSQRMGAGGIYGHAGSQRPQFAGYGDSGGASRFFPAFRYEAKVPRAERPRLEDGTTHCTVKPLDLIRWLCRLVVPPGGLILDPFAGTGPVGEAAIIEGFRAILMDKDLDAVKLARTRLGKDIQPDLFGGGSDAA